MARRDLVVIGASAGGVEALRALMSGLPADLPAAVCVVLHIGAHPSQLPFILSAAGRLPARHPEDGERLLMGQVYVAPPDHHLLVDGPVLRVTRGPKEHHSRPAVDPLFRSAALSAGARCIGVVLTGSLDDGAAGLQAIQQCGGVTIIQDPNDAADPSRPAAALQLVRPDHCIAVTQIAAALLVELTAATPDPLQPPLRLVREHRVSLGVDDGMDELRDVAAPSTLTCPDCHGTLWEIDGSRPSRYRCHTGHAFSLRSLVAAQAEVTEDALWSGVRALKEKELLLCKIVALDRQANDEAHALRTESEADQVRDQAEVLRKLVKAP